MSRRTLLNVLENIFEPLTNRAMKEDMLGKRMKTTSLAAETTITLDFGEYLFHYLEIGSDNVTVNFTTTGLTGGEHVYLKTKNGSTKKTITWGTGVINPSSLAMTDSNNAIDLFHGVFDGTNIILGAFAQAVS